MGKIVLFIFYVLQVATIFSQIETTIFRANDTMNSSDIYMLFREFKEENSKIYYKTTPQPQIYTAKYKDTIRSLFELKLTFNTINNKCICTFSDLKEYCIYDSVCEYNDTERLHDVYDYIQNELFMRLFYVGSFDNDIVYFCLPIKFVPLNNHNIKDTTNYMLPYKESVDSSPPQKSIYPLVISDSSFYHILVNYFAINKKEVGYVLLMDIKRTASKGYSIKLMIVDSNHLEAAIKREFNFRKRQIGLSDIEQVKCIVFGCANPIFRKETHSLYGNSSIVENVLFSLKTKKQCHKSKGNHNEYEFGDEPPERSGTSVHYFFYKDGEFMPRFYKDVVW